MHTQFSGSPTGRRTLLAALLGTGAALLASCAADPLSPTGPAPTAATSPSAPAPAPSPPVEATAPARAVPGRGAVLSAYASKPSGAFGLEAKGIELGLPATARGAALTFDACGGPGGEGYDAALMAALRKHRAPATLFINQRWARANPGLVRELAADPLFEIANHGTTHAPLASRGQGAYGIPGTASIGAAYDEIMDNQRHLADTFGIRAKFFRSGTAHMDELGAALCRELGLVPMNFTVNLDAGATFRAAGVAAQTRQLRAGDVGIGHFNRPSSGTARGVAEALPGLLESLAARKLALLTLSEAFGARTGTPSA
ncbi:polysaccharide deacetylase family protein [Paeniglutamicibacter psychrophenolicus]|uniref:Peptidoglycan/xylan/chitin deacetylase (PgdA/CDA1 family) n=1 Tax=Paeniglutamicibacter psychrophenolicus TaxID=257454 RepID=A0ABS4WGD1_9MICC|nr:polysaccharide deacetylase family protein [Paeniglutamicibacter psychrophenolicus]MBP2375183.1 peptidoglycan/xylan/chitin deacetylase (PgdA/CDA1 family) [Paeniglutamicibacter psychrophenolicus]